ncbi:MAG: DivIVA domain-containing protein [Mogibacterium sp.]|nr:DivIVA domain-containing protein [Mogibacterium sp.]
MIMPIDIDKKEFTRDKRGYNSREVDEFLDLIIVDYEKVLNDNRSMAHKIKFLEKQLEEAQKSDTAMLDTLETAKRLMADISASAERRAELMIRDAELEAETMILDAKATVRKLNDEHIVLSGKVERLRKNFRRLLEAELEDLDADEYEMNKEMDRSDLPELDREFGLTPPVASDTLVVRDEADAAQDQIVAQFETSKEAGKASVEDLSDGLRKMAEDSSKLDETIILK